MCFRDKISSNLWSKLPFSPRHDDVMWKAVNLRNSIKWGHLDYYLSSTHSWRLRQPTRGKKEKLKNFICCEKSVFFIKNFSKKKGFDKQPLAQLGRNRNEHKRVLALSRSETAFRSMLCNGVGEHDRISLSSPSNSSLVSWALIFDGVGRECACEFTFILKHVESLGIGRS